MTEKQEKPVRMPFPEDTFNKRQFPYFGDAFHKIHNLPGEYLYNIPTELKKSRWRHCNVRCCISGKIA